MDFEIPLQGLSAKFFKAIGGFQSLNDERVGNIITRS
jgi:hypothetical protein